MGKKKKGVGTCELCGRENVQTTVHHLTPREFGGGHMPTANLCIPCHKQVHALYSNEELALRLNTIEALQQEKNISSFLKWIRKQPSSKIPKIKKANARRR